ncbi:MAG TPA: riboflavin synthase [Steroidobacteraceae bacterium]|nr:riboflavin synthase [Steroidobacteraceae bacterium]
MFTGIVQSVGEVVEAQPRDGDLVLTLDASELAAKVEAHRLAVGESICVSGVCLTVVRFDGRRFVADVSRETLAVTTLGSLAPGDKVNLEAALRAGDPLGGHLVSGHVDAVASVTGLERDARSLRVTVEVPPQLRRFVVPKGSVALNGVSLTVNQVEQGHLSVNLIPHTVAATTFSAVKVGGRLNLEVDQLARYAQGALQK